MKASRITIAIVGLLLSGRALHAQQPVEFLVRESAAPCLNIRVSPSSNAAAHDCLAPGTRVTGIGTAPYWREVRLADGRTGWAAKKYLELADSAPPSPAVTAIRDDAWLEVHFVDVGQGDGIWIHTFDDGIPGNGRYEGRNIVIDGGPNGSDASNQMLAYLRQRAHEGAVIDALLVTHPHDDHYPGASGILRHFDVRNYYDPGYPKSGSEWAAFVALVRAERSNGVPVTRHVGPAAVGPLDWGSEVRAEILYAYPGAPTGLGSGNTLENNASIVLRLEYGEQSILFMGDAEGKERDDDPATPRFVEARLLDSPGAAGLKSTVLKIAHHGSETSSTLPFIAAVDPDYLVVTSGRRRYGSRYLPDATTLQRYCDHNPQLRIYRTDQDDEAEGRSASTDEDGDHVVLRTNGQALIVEAYSGGTRITPTTCAP